MSNFYGYFCDNCGKEIRSDDKEFKKWIQIDNINTVENFKFTTGAARQFCSKKCLHEWINKKFED